MNPRVVQLITGLEPAGAETQMVRLSVELRRRGWDVSVCCMIRPGLAATWLRDAGIEMVSLAMTPGVPGPRGMVRLAAVLDRLRPQVLHCHMFHANVLGRVARLICPVPVVISTIHSVVEARASLSGGAKPQSTRARDLAYRLTDFLTDADVSVSKIAAERHVACRAVSREKLRVIPNAIDTRRFRPDPERSRRTREELGLGSRFVWLTAGRLMWKKDHATLLRAFATLSGATLLLAGDGPLEGELRALAGELNVDARFLGRREDMPDLMNAADGFAMSSLIEGLPVALLEALASGLPVVTTNAGGAQEAVVEGETGFVTPVGDVSALAAAMSRVMSAPASDRARMAAASRSAAARYDSGASATKWEALYRELLEGPARWT